MSKGGSAERRRRARTVRVGSVVDHGRVEPQQHVVAAVYAEGVALELPERLHSQRGAAGGKRGACCVVYFAVGVAARIQLVEEGPVEVLEAHDELLAAPARDVLDEERRAGLDGSRGEGAAPGGGRLGDDGGGGPPHEVGEHRAVGEAQGGCGGGGGRGEGGGRRCWGAAASL